jgi:hypothetical protein
MGHWDGDVLRAWRCCHWICVIWKNSNVISPFSNIFSLIWTSGIGMLSITALVAQEVAFMKQ